MKREQPKETPKGGRWGTGAKSYSTKELRTALELFREMLMEVDAILVRMDERKIESITIPAGAGGAATDRAEKAIQAWARGLRAALLERIKNGEE